MPRLKLTRFKAVEPLPDVLDHFVRFYNSKDLYHHFDQQPPISAPSLFGNERPMAFDLGCGRGEFIAARAADHPDLNFVGFDWHQKSIWKAIENVQKAGVENVRFVRADFRRVLPLVPEETVAVAYLLFPPPVMEYKRRKKDVIIDSSLREIHRVLMPDSLLHFVTDSPEYFETKKTLIEESGLFEIVTMSQELEGGITRFQRFWESFEIESNRLACRKLSGPAERTGPGQ